MNAMQTAVQRVRHGRWRTLCRGAIRGRFGGTGLVTVEKGREALEALASARFDLVLMDMQMPEMDGLSVTRLWREREVLLQLPRAPVVMLTAHALSEHAEESLRAGPTAT